MLTKEELNELKKKIVLKKHERLILAFDYGYYCNFKKHYYSVISVSLKYIKMGELNKLLNMPIIAYDLSI